MFSMSLDESPGWHQNLKSHPLTNASMTHNFLVIKVSFQVVPWLPRKANSVLYLVIYRACQLLPVVTPWQTIVAQRVDVSYSAVARLRTLQNNVGLAILLLVGAAAAALFATVIRFAFFP